MGKTLKKKKKDTTSCHLLCYQPGQPFHIGHHGSFLASLPASTFQLLVCSQQKADLSESLSFLSPKLSDSSLRKQIIRINAPTPCEVINHLRGGKLEGSESGRKNKSHFGDVKCVMRRSSGANRGALSLDPPTRASGLISGSQLGVILPPGDTGQCVETFLAITPGTEGVLLVSSGWRSETLLAIPPLTGRPG